MFGRYEGFKGTVLDDFRPEIRNPCCAISHDLPCFIHNFPCSFPKLVSCLLDLLILLFIKEMLLFIELVESGKRDLLFGFVLFDEGGDGDSEFGWVDVVGGLVLGLRDGLAKEVFAGASGRFHRESLLSH